MEILQNENIALLFEKACLNHSEQTILIQDDTTISYHDFQKQVSQTMATFQAKGLQQGDRVLVLVPMSIDLYRVVLAIISLGAVPVFLDEWVSLKRLKVCCELANCKGIVASTKFRFLGFFISFLRKIPIKLSLHFDSKVNSPNTCVKVSGEDTALITFTTGSTGKPKAANRTHAFLKHQFLALQPYLMNSNSVVMTMLPIVILLNMAMGKTSVFADFSVRKPSKFNPQNIAETLVKRKVQTLITSPYFLQRLADYCFDKEIKLPFSEIISGGAPVFPVVAEKILKAFPNTNFSVLYGSTEAEPISHCYANEIVKAKNEFGLYAGKIHSTAKVKIIPTNTQDSSTLNDQQLEEMSLPSGSVGEIIVSGAHILSGYIDNPEAEAQFKIKTETSLWHKTGDLGYLTDSGELYLLGRNEISTPNSKIYPYEIEQKLTQIKGVSKGTVIEKEGKLILVLQANTIPDIEWSTLLGFSPDKIITLPSIPLDPRHHSKIDYGKLEQLVVI